LFYTINSTIFALSASFTGSRYNGIVYNQVLIQVQFQVLLVLHLIQSLH